MKGKIFLGILAMIALIAVLTVGQLTSWGFRFATAELKGTVEQQETVTGGDYRIAAYEWFYNQIVVITGLEADLEAQTALLENLTPGTKRHDDTLTNIAAIGANLKRQKAEYNARSAMERTQAQWKDADLPDKIQ